MLCLPWDSCRVSNNCLKIEQVFELRQEGSVENPEPWQEILHVRHVKSRKAALAGFSGPVDWPSSVLMPAERPLMVPEVL